MADEEQQDAFHEMPGASSKLKRLEETLGGLPPDALGAWATMKERETGRVSTVPAKYRKGEFARMISAMDFFAGKIAAGSPKAGQWAEIMRASLRPADLVESIKNPPSSRAGELVLRKSGPDDGAALMLMERFNPDEENLQLWFQKFFYSIPEKWFDGIGRDEIVEYFSRAHPLDAMRKLNEILAPKGLALYPVVQGKLVERMRLAPVYHTVTSGNGEFLKGFVTDEESLLKEADGYFDPVMRQIFVRGSPNEDIGTDVKNTYFHERQHLFDFLSGYSAKVNRMEDTARKLALIEATSYARDSIARFENGEDAPAVGGRLESISRKNGIGQPFEELHELIDSHGPGPLEATEALRAYIDGKYSEVLGVSFSEIFGSVL